jgi:hypothetical protein
MGYSTSTVYIQKGHLERKDMKKEPKEKKKNE